MSNSSRSPSPTRSDAETTDRHGPSRSRPRHDPGTTEAEAEVDASEVASVVPSIATATSVGGKAKLEALLGAELARVVLQIVKLHRSITAQKRELKGDPRHAALRETTRQLNLVKKNARQAIAKANRKEIRYGGIVIAVKQGRKTRKPEQVKAAVSQACSENGVPPRTVDKVMSAIDAEPVTRINVTDVKEKEKQKQKQQAASTKKRRHRPSA